MHVHHPSGPLRPATSPSTLHRPSPDDNKTTKTHHNNSKQNRVLLIQTWKRKVRFPSKPGNNTARQTPTTGVPPLPAAASTMSPQPFPRVPANSIAPRPRDNQTSSTVQTRFKNRKRLPSTPQWSSTSSTIFPRYFVHYSIIQQSPAPSSLIDHRRYPSFPSLMNPELLSNPFTKNLDFSFKIQNFVLALDSIAWIHEL